MRQMKLLTLMVLILAISTQPLLAGSCAMVMGQGGSAGVEMPMDMDHGDGHDCCDTGATETEEPCEGGAHCGHCTVVSPALSSVLKLSVAWHAASEFAFDGGILLPSHSSPPFRPPIS